MPKKYDELSVLDIFLPDRGLNSLRFVGNVLAQNVARVPFYLFYPFCQSVIHLHEYRKTHNKAKLRDAGLWIFPGFIALPFGIPRAAMSLLAIPFNILNGFTTSFRKAIGYTFPNRKNKNSGFKIMDGTHYPETACYYPKIARQIYSDEHLVSEQNNKSYKTAAKSNTLNKASRPHTFFELNKESGNHKHCSQPAINKSNLQCKV